MIILVFSLLFIKINDINRVEAIDEGGENVFQIRLKELRESRGLSQADLARAIHTKQSTVAMWENGTNRPRNATLEKLANFFGVSTDYLLGRTDDAGLGSNIQITDENNRPIVLDDDALELIDSLRSRPEMKMLFSVSKKATAEDIIKAVKIIEALKDESEN